MPNTPVWGSETEDREADQDLISLGNEIIEVADIEDDSRIALKASNKDGASSVAFEAEGQLKVTAVDTDNPASKAIHTVNDSINASAKAIEAEGQCEVNVYAHISDPALNALKVTNANTNANGRALLVSNGKSEFQDDVDIDGDIDVDTGHTLKINDLNGAGNALETINSGAGNALKVQGDVDVSDGGCIKINDVNDQGGGANKIALHSKNSRLVRN